MASRLTPYDESVFSDGFSERLSLRRSFAGSSGPTKIPSGESPARELSRGRTITKDDAVFVPPQRADTDKSVSGGGHLAGNDPAGRRSGDAKFGKDRLHLRRSPVPVSAERPWHWRRQDSGHSRHPSCGNLVTIPGGATPTSTFFQSMVPSGVAQACFSPLCIATPVTMTCARTRVFEDTYASLSATCDDDCVCLNPNSGPLLAGAIFPNAPHPVALSANYDTTNDGGGGIAVEMMPSRRCH